VLLARGAKFTRSVRIGSLNFRTSLQTCSRAPARKCYDAWLQWQAADTKFAMVLVTLAVMVIEIGAGIALVPRR
jgi:hypothetical protein